MEEAAASDRFGNDDFAVLADSGGSALEDIQRLVKEQTLNGDVLVNGEINNRESVLRGDYVEVCANNIEIANFYLGKRKWLP